MADREAQAIVDQALALARSHPAAPALKGAPARDEARLAREWAKHVAYPDEDVARDQSRIERIAKLAELNRDPQRTEEKGREAA